MTRSLKVSIKFLFLHSLDSLGFPVGEIREPDDGREGDDTEEGNSHETKKNNGGLAARWFKSGGGAGKEKRISYDVFLEVAVVVVGGEEEAESCHTASYQVIRPGASIQSNCGDQSKREHENALPPTEGTDGCQVGELVDECADDGCSRETANQRHPGGIGDAV